MVEMIILINDYITEFRFRYKYSEDLRIGFKNGIHRFLRSTDNKSLNFYFKLLLIEYI